MQLSLVTEFAEVCTQFEEKPYSPIRLVIVCLHISTFCWLYTILGKTSCRPTVWAYGKAGNGNEMETGMETGNGNWKQKWEQQTHQSCTGATFFHSVLSHYSSIPLSSRYGIGFMTHVLPLLLYCAL